MKAKIKVKVKTIRIDCVHYYYETKVLKMYVKLENSFLSYCDTIISQDSLQISDEEFYDKVIEFLSDIDNIKKKGEEVVRKIYEIYLEKQNKKGKEKEVKELLKKLKKPIEIEVKL